jgi:hypothetical protein
MALFHEAVDTNGHRMAQDCHRLASLITADIQEGEIVLVSLARAGTPVGVIVKNIVEQEFGRACAHYSLSIIRDRGIDTVALDYIRKRHMDRSIVFVDGWTGKGVIGRELNHSVAAYNARTGARVSSALYVLSDLCGLAYRAATGEDYLIPSAILNATVSGLVSRSILNDCVGPNDFHACIYHSEFSDSDLSIWFARKLTLLALNQQPSNVKHGEGNGRTTQRELQSRSNNYLASAMQRYGITDVNLIKPGIGEATRVLLRRVPKRLILRDVSLPEVSHLRTLAEEKQVFIEEDRELPYKAVSLIRSVLDG